MKITDKWLEKKNPCQEALNWWDKKERNSTIIIENLISEKHYEWANWFIVRLMKRDQKIKYAIYASEQVIGIYEKKYPTDNKPRKAIQAAKKYLKDKSTKNKNAANAAANAAAAAYAAAYAANAADVAVAYAAAAAYTAAYAAVAVAVADADAYTAAYTAAYARGEMQLKILIYGMKLL
jgi:hypothetical protein